MSVRASALKLGKFSLAYLFISHDRSMVLRLADGGHHASRRIVEIGRGCSRPRTRVAA
jgi:hypothetical protein